MGEKTEKATPKKLKDARQKGQVAKSQDFPSVFTFAVSVSTVLTLAPWLYEQFGGMVINIFASLPSVNLEEQGAGLARFALMEIARLSIPILMVVVGVGVAINFLLIGPIFTFEVFKPDIKKFNPVTNLKNKFKVKTLIELLKSLFKVIGASIIIYYVVLDSIPVLTTTVKMPMLSSIMLFYTFLYKVVIRVGLFFFVIAVADLIYQRISFANEMKMEKFEIKQEHKNTEGDPQIKGKRKEIAREIAYSDGPSAAVGKSKAVVTNPTHIAVGIAYDPEDDAAPWITIQGSDILAQRIVALAEKQEVPIIRNVELAHNLLDNGVLYHYVPKESFEPLAEILRWIQSFEEGDKPGESDDPLNVELE